jgi:membrane protein
MNKKRIGGISEFLREKIFRRPRRKSFLEDLKDKFLTIFNLVNDKNIGVLAAGIAYFTSLAFFPSVAALLAISSSLIRPDQVQSVVDALNIYLPKDIASLVSVQIQNQSGQYSGNFIIATVAIVIALFGASAAVDNTIKSLNVAYDIKETRNIIKLKVLSIFLTIGALLGGLIVIGLLVINENFLEHWGVPHVVTYLLPYVRWIVILLVVSLSIAILYKYGANRRQTRWRWFTWGATIATALWLLATIVFFIYAQYFASFSQSYSIFAGVIVLMIWLNLSATAILIGALINAQFEAHRHHTH